MNRLFFLSLFTGLHLMLFRSGMPDLSIFTQPAKEPRIFQPANKFQSGDIIFQSTNHGQSKAIQLATHSKYTHCGLIIKEGEELLVYEAVQPVTRTPLKQWISRGDNRHYVVKRLKDADEILSLPKIDTMKKILTAFYGRDYDLWFEWDDDKIYCSELVWKAYKRSTGLEIGKLQKLKDFDLSHETVKSIMKKRYGDHVPYGETVVSPAAIFESELLRTVYSN